MGRAIALVVSLLAIIASVALATRVDAGACTPPDPPRPRIVAVPDVIPTDGGLLVRASNALGAGDPAFGMVSGGRMRLLSGGFEAGGRQIAARLVPLAAGLSRLEPTEPLEGEALWVTSSERRALRFGQRAPSFANAPGLMGATMRVTRSRANGEDVDVTRRFGVVLRQPPPEAARALVVYEAGSSIGTLETAVDHTNPRRIEVATGASCNPFSWPFPWPPSRGRVEVAFVDAWGRLSPVSRAVSVR